MSMYISLFTVAIPINYTSEFQEIFEATMYIRQLQHICLVLYYLYVRLFYLRRFSAGITIKINRKDVFDSICTIIYVKNEISIILKRLIFCLEFSLYKYPVASMITMLYKSMLHLC
jgi:hypothetical protein